LFGDEFLSFFESPLVTLCPHRGKKGVGLTLDAVERGGNRHRGALPGGKFGLVGALSHLPLVGASGEVYNSFIVQLLRKATLQPTSERDGASLIMEVVPLVMRTIRTEMRRLRGPDLSVPQLRALIFLQRQPKTSLSAMAEYVGLTLPSASRMVEVLVERQLVTRQTSASDRRCVTLALTARGTSTLESARRSTRARLAARLAELSAADQDRVVEALRILREVFAPNRDIEA